MRVMPIIGGVLLDQIPFAMLIPHEDRAVLTHGQSLEKLASRGGLSPQEALAILDNVRQTPASLASCEFELINKVRDWRAGTKVLADQGSAGPPQSPANLQKKAAEVIREWESHNGSDGAVYLISAKALKVCQLLRDFRGAS